MKKRIDLSDHEVYPGVICPLGTNLDPIETYVDRGFILDFLTRIEGEESVSFRDKKYGVTPSKKGVLLKNLEDDESGATLRTEFEFEFMGEWIRSLHALEGEGGAEHHIHLPPMDYGLNFLALNVIKRIAAIREFQVDADVILRKVMRSQEFSSAVRWFGPCLGNSEALYEKKMHEVLYGVPGSRMLAAMNQLIVPTQKGAVHVNMHQLGRGLFMYQNLPSRGKTHQKDSWSLSVERAERSTSITRVSLERFHHLA